MKKTTKLFHAFAFCALIPLAGAFSFDLLDFVTTGNNLDKIVKTVDSSMNSLSAVKKAAETITPADAYEIGRSVSASILQKYELLNAPKATAYLNKMCKAIALNSDKPVIFKDYCVGILKTDEVNAVSSCGGHIFITAGLLRCCDSEDAVASVIAHEMAHIQLEHAVAAIKADRTKKAVTSSVSTATGVLDDYGSWSAKDKLFFEAFAGSNVVVMGKLFDTGYPKEQEFKADELAVKMLVRTGYDPNAMIDMLKVLDELHKNKSIAKNGWKKTHPKPVDRIKRAQAAMAQNSFNGSDRSVRQNRFSANIGGKI